MKYGGFCMWVGVQIEGETTFFQLLFIFIAFHDTISCVVELNLGASFFNLENSAELD
jgi:hypothetical protein